MSFGKLLSEKRKRNELTSKKLSELCGVSRSYITLMENDKRLPGRKVIPKLALALNLKTEEVINWYLEALREKLK